MKKQTTQMAHFLLTIKLMKALILSMLLLLLNLSLYAQANRVHPADSLYQRNVTDSVDFRSNPAKKIIDTSIYQNRQKKDSVDSLQMDDRKPKKLNPGRDKIK